MMAALRRWRSRVQSPLAFLLFLLPTTASAHLTSTGLGPAYDGIYHFVLSPEQALPMAALALFAGRRGPAHARYVTFLLPAAWLCASLAEVVPSAAVAALLPACALLAAGALLASDVTAPPHVTTALAVLLGATLGALYGAPTFSVEGDVAAAACVFVMLALLASLALPLRRMPAIIAVRVTGSWTAALGLLLVGWFLHGRAQ
jgi:urease accessory protein